MKGFEINGREYPRGVYSGGAYSAGRNQDGSYDVYFDAKSHGMTDDHWEMMGTYTADSGNKAVKLAIGSARGG